MPRPRSSSVGVDVAVVVVTHNSAQQLGDCLAAVPGALEGVDRWRLVIVDNGSSDATTAIAAEHVPEATLVELGRNAGYAAAINEAARECADATNLLVLNPDVRMAPQSVRALVDVLDRPGVGIAVPRLVDEHGQLQHSLRHEASVSRSLADALLGGRRASRWRLGESLGDPLQYAVERPIDWATGAAMLVSADCLEAVAPWDESFFLYSEETDFCLRARDAGWLTWFTPAAEAVHLGGESNTSARLWSLLAINRVRAFRKRHGIVSSALFWCVVVLNEVLRVLRGSTTHRAALKALFRPRAHHALLRHPQDSGGDPAPWICFSAQDWWYHNQAHSDFQLMRRVARERQVLFVNSIGMRMPLPGRSTQAGRRIMQKAKSILRFIRRPLPGTPGFVVITPVVVPLYGSEFVRSFNARLVRTQVRLAAWWTGVDLAASVVVVTIPTAWDVVRGMAYRRLIVNRSDLHSAFEETNQTHIRQLEHQLLRNSDVVLYASHQLMATECEISGDRAVFFDHGVDLERFGGQVGPEPADLTPIPRPRVGFFGGLDDYLVDFALLEHLGRALPDVSLVLIGDATCSMERFDSMPNVHWLGFKAYDEIPAYGSGFDVALMPWLRNDWIRHSNPIKLKEYLALGLPIVSTDFPEVHHYGDLVAIARTYDDFVSQVRAALNGQAAGSEASRRARVAGATWEDRVSQLLALGESPLD
jgi:GT2 family glycosyltransferase